MSKGTAESIDAIVTDPPYGLHFMGKSWDQFGGPTGRDNTTHSKRGGAMKAGTYDLSPSGQAGFQAFMVQFGVEALRVLKPGGYLLAFGGTRTFHRLAVALEDAGFEIRDCLSWLYGTGFPKSLDVSKAIDKAAGAEREVVGTKRLGGNAAQSTQEKGGTYASNTNSVGVAPIDVPITAPATPQAQQWQGWGTALKPAWEPIILARKPLGAPTVAANVLEHGVGGLNIDGTRISTDENLNGGAYKRDHGETDGSSGGNATALPLTSHRHDGTENWRYQHGGAGEFEQPPGRWPANVTLDEEAAAMLDEQSGVSTSGAAGKHGSSGFAAGYDGDYSIPYGDTGGASRFFYVAKASRKERGEGNDHPTVKPIALMQWLVRLVTPPDGRVLDPFMGSGTTALACLAEGFDFIGIEQDPHYVEIAQARIKSAQEDAA